LKIIKDCGAVGIPEFVRNDLSKVRNYDEGNARIFGFQEKG
jgi:hypothetical protein